MSKIIIANWKMNLSIEKSLEFVKKVNKTKHIVGIAAPYTFLCEMKKALAHKKIKLAAQDVAKYEEGAYTGEVSAKMLKKLNCSYCLVGHSERRVYFAETDTNVNEKIKQLLNHRIKPVLCVGEKASERNKKLTKRVLNKQLKIGLKGIKNVENMIVAYEPIWAISTFQKGKNKQSASMSDIVEVHQYIKNLLEEMYKAKGTKIKVLYGGSVKPSNSKEILSLKEVDGALIGGASLKVSSFNDILHSVK
jgi:triosephosphate isomerase (TIM)